MIITDENKIKEYYNHPRCMIRADALLFSMIIKGIF